VPRSLVPPLAGMTRSPHAISRVVFLLCCYISFDIALTEQEIHAKRAKTQLKLSGVVHADLVLDSSDPVSSK
jgi:hypothetical protein